MNRYLTLIPSIVFFAAILAGPRLAEAEDVEVIDLCPNVRVIGEDPKLNDVEKRLVCGDPKSDGWRHIPWNQASFHLKSFLQQRGFQQATFDREAAGPSEGPENVKRLVVRTGEPTKVTALRAEGAPPELRIERKRKVVGARLTPALLDDVEKWVKSRLQANGYACPTVKTTGNPQTGEIVVTMETGPKQNLIAIEEEPIPGLWEKVLRRYDAFRIGETYNGDWMAVTETRIAMQNLLDAVHFTPRCVEEGVIAWQQAVAGPPRLLVFGAGINTEGLLLGKANWRHTRLGRNASWADVTALASSQEQRLDLTLNWYPVSPPSRFSIRPQAQLRHLNLEHYETISARAQVGPATTWDNQDLGIYALSIGPVYEQFRTLRGVQAANQRDTHFLSLGGEIRLRTHEFEYYFKSPRSGYNVLLNAYVNDPSLLSDAAAQRVEVLGESLWNYRDYDPPLWVVGVRGGFGGVFTPERPGPDNRLPPTFMRFLGGANDLRGWGRQELPTNGYGALTSAFLDTELRLVATLPLGLEPFGFIDLGALGNEPASLDSPLLYSPGFGMRWQSPVGVIRTTLAHGFPESVSSHWQFYFSFGEEF